MKTILQGFAFLFFMIIISCSTKNIYQIDWNQSQNSSGSIPKYSDSDALMAYDVSNDSSNLYLSIMIGDENTQMQTMMSGIEVWLDTTKKASKNFGLLFPLKMQPGQGMKMERPSPDQPPKIESMQEQYLTHQKQFRAVGLNGFNDGLNSLENNLGLSLSLQFDSTGYFIYKAIIPFSCLHISSFETIDSTDIFSLTLIVPGIELPDMPGGPGMGGGMPGGGFPGGDMPGPPPGGMGGGPGGPPNMSGMIEDKVIRFKFTLNRKN